MSDGPISLDDERRRRRGCPIEALGHANGEFVFRDPAGQVRRLLARQLGDRWHLAALFIGNTSWLTSEFPRIRLRKTIIDGELVSERAVVGFEPELAADYLMRAARRAGLVREPPPQRRRRGSAGRCAPFQ